MWDMSPASLICLFRQNNVYNQPSHDYACVQVGHIMARAVATVIGGINAIDCLF